MEVGGEKGEGMYFKDEEEALLAYQNGDLGLHAKVKIRMKREIDGEEKTKTIETTVGKVIFNEVIPQDLGFVEQIQKKNSI